jgi:hypothetical protein
MHSLGCLASSSWRQKNEERVENLKAAVSSVDLIDKNTENAKHELLHVRLRGRSGLKS